VETRSQQDTEFLPRIFRTKRQINRHLYGIARLSNPAAEPMTKNIYPEGMDDRNMPQIINKIKGTSVYVIFNEL